MVCFPLCRLGPSQSSPGEKHYSTLRPKCEEGTSSPNLYIRVMHAGGELRADSNLVSNERPLWVIRGHRLTSVMCQTATLISLFDHLDRAWADGDRHVQRRRHERSARFLPESARPNGGRADQSWRARLRHLFAAFEGAHHLHYRPDQRRDSYTGCRAATVPGSRESEEGNLDVYQLPGRDCDLGARNL